MSETVPLSVVVLAAASGEVGNIEQCLGTLAWCDEQLVVDAFSSDGTSHAVGPDSRVVERQFVNFSAQRQASLQLASYDWVLFVDADERVPEGLAAEVRERAGLETHAAYTIPRRNRIFGWWMQGSGWSPDRQLRLMDRRRVCFRSERTVHEVADVDGTVGEIDASLIHHSYGSVREFRCRQRRYARMMADDLYAAGVRRRPMALVAQPLREIRRRLVEYRGYRDRWVGVILALLMAEYEWLVQRGLARRWRRRGLSR